MMKQIDPKHEPTITFEDIFNKMKQVKKTKYPAIAILIVIAIVLQVITDVIRGTIQKEV
jgi:ABC-type arginine/histidine transport system permease subunit